jgi:hypothetical protein
MGRPELHLIVADSAARRPSRTAAVLLASCLAALAALATLLGADAARVRTDPLSSARQVLMGSLTGGAGEDGVRSELIALRDRAARLPLDARARAAYASLLAGTARDQETLEVAAFHAGVAVRLAPVTVPVVRAATLVLAQAGRTGEAVELVRGMFAYDPNAAARLLLLLEPQLARDETARAVAETPRAFLARAAVLLGARRVGEAAALVDEGVTRWPQDLDLLALAAARAVAAQDWARAAALLPRDLTLPDEPAAAMLLVYRARSRAAGDDALGAAQDLERAAVLGAAMPVLLREAGDGWLALERLDRAREMWNRALHATAASEVAQRADTVRRLARLDELEGRSGTALRLWREVLVLAPGDSEAERRIADLGRGS